MPHFKGNLPFPSPDSVVILVVVLLMIVLISIVPLLIDLSLLRSHPFRLCLVMVISAFFISLVKARMIMMGRPLSLYDHYPCSLVM
jgi:hypothetical protein